MPAPIRQTERDACPGALRLHSAADGKLARVRLPGGMLTGSQLAALGEMAERWGDGCIELTSRANVQLRGLRGEVGAELASALADAGLLPSAAHELVRNIAAAPLATASIRDLVRELDAGLCADPELVALPGRFLFALGETDLRADVAISETTDNCRYALTLSGVDSGIRVGAAEVVPVMLAAAHGFLAEQALHEQALHEPRPWRLHEIPDGPSRIAARLRPRFGFSPEKSDTEASPVGRLVGVIAQEESVAMGALVPLGRLSRVQIDVVKRAERLAVTSARGLVIFDLTPERAERWRADLAAAGLATEPGSRWTGVTACAGRPGCAKSLADVRADATASIRYDDGLPVHFLGCERGCGSPAGRHVRVLATIDGYTVDGQPVGRRAAGEKAGAGRTGGDPAASGLATSDLGTAISKARRMGRVE